MIPHAVAITDGKSPRTADVPAERKIVFLDMDGVVNCATFFQAASKTQFRRKKGAAKAAMRSVNGVYYLDEFADRMIDEAAVARLNAILARTGCEFVLSSSWRIAYRLDEVEMMLHLRGFHGSLVDKTPVHIQGPADEAGREYLRGYEIAKWLEAHPEVVAFVILDDGSDMAHLRFNLVQTPWQDGLQDVHVERAIAMLGALPDGPCMNKDCPIGCPESHCFPLYDDQGIYE